MSRRWAWVALALLGSVLLVGTLGPSPGELFASVTREGVDERTFGAVEVGANVVLFVPVAFLVAAALPRLPGWAVWTLCVAASTAVELVQTTVPERVPSLRDVVLNAAGAAVGVLAHSAVDRHRRRRRAYREDVRPEEASA